MVTRRTFLASAAVAFDCPASWGRRRPVKVGDCTRDVDERGEVWFDYIEPAAAEMAAMSKDHFREFSDTVLASPSAALSSIGFIQPA
jgi:hypothetical protein